MFGNRTKLAKELDRLAGLEPTHGVDGKPLPPHGLFDLNGHRTKLFRSPRAWDMTLTKESVAECRMLIEGR